jgi:hypothetical protein
MMRITAAALCLALAACSDPPSIGEVMILKDTVDERERIPVSVIASGASEYLWSASAGSFTDDTAAETTWIAPIVSDTSHEPASASHTIRVMVGNADGTSEETIEVTVNNINEVPQIASASASDDSPLPGDTVTLTVAASDGDDADLVYQWRQLAPAEKLAITGDTTTEATVQMPVTAEAQGYEFSITVLDPSEAEVVRTVNTVLIVPAFAADVLPILGNAGADCGSCHKPGEEQGGFTFDPDDSAGVAAAHDAIVYTALNPTVGQISCDSGGGAMDMYYVIPQDPSSSGLFQKIAGTGCSGARMPAGDTGYFDANSNELDIIESWILAGAPNN